MLPELPPELIGIVVTISGALGIYYRKRIMGNASEAETETALRNYLANAGLPTPKQTEVSKQHVLESINEAVPDEDADILTLDGTYYAPTTRAEAEKMLILGDILDYFPYRPDRFDCENYALFLSSLTALIFGVNTVALVVDWSEGYAYNLVVTAQGDAFAVESQTGEVVELGEGGYDLSNGEVHL